VAGDILPRLTSDGAGLVTIYCYRGRGSVQLWRTVFERRAPTSLHRLEALGCEVKQGNTMYQISEELLDTLTDAYREATGKTTTPPAPRVATET
jgi:hypothetical protein